MPIAFGYWDNMFPGSVISVRDPRLASTYQPCISPPRLVWMDIAYRKPFGIVALRLRFLFVSGHFNTFYLLAKSNCQMRCSGRTWPQYRYYPQWNAVQASPLIIVAAREM